MGDPVREDQVRNKSEFEEVSFDPMDAQGLAGAPSFFAVEDPEVLTVKPYLQRFAEALGFNGAAETLDHLGMADQAKVGEDAAHFDFYEYLLHGLSFP